MADRVFIADYIKKKRRRKGNLEYLVKWKGYPTRLCTWEPQENILDASLIKQFEEEGYDPRRVRAACRKKKRRRSEITESRSLPLPFYDSDSEHEPRTPPHDLLKKHKNKVSPISLSKYGGVWQADATSKRGDTLFKNETKNQSEQKKRKLDLDPIDNKENEVKLHDSTYKNGGKSCHPKMRAKYMFRTGDFENADWGYDWSSSDNESLKGTSIKQSTDQSENSKDINPAMIFPQKSINQNFLHSLSEISSVTSESTIPAIDEMEDSARVTELDWNRPASCPMLDNTFLDEPFPPILEIDESMPTLRNENENICFNDETEELAKPTETGTDQLLETKPEVDIEAYREHIFVTEVTLDNLTVIIHESDKMKGFFKYET